MESELQSLGWGGNRNLIIDLALTSQGSGCDCAIVCPLSLSPGVSSPFKVRIWIIHCSSLPPLPSLCICLYPITTYSTSDSQTVWKENPLYCEIHSSPYYKRVNQIWCIVGKMPYRNIVSNYNRLLAMNFISMLNNAVHSSESDSLQGTISYSLSCNVPCPYDAFVPIHSMYSFETRRPCFFSSYHLWKGHRVEITHQYIYWWVISTRSLPIYILCIYICRLYFPHYGRTWFIFPFTEWSRSGFPSQKSRSRQSV